MALSRINANSIQDGTVVAADIADGSITTAKIANDAITTAKIADGNVTAAKVSTITVEKGGTGATTLNANSVIIGNTTGSVKFIDPGTTGNVLTSDGNTWVSQAVAPTATGANVQTFNSSGTWYCPTTGSMAQIQVWGGGGGASRATAPVYAAGGGGGGHSTLTLPLSCLTSNVCVVVGAGGAGRTGSCGDGTSGGTSCFGTCVRASGGGGGAIASCAAGAGGLPINSAGNGVSLVLLACNPEGGWIRAQESLGAQTGRDAAGGFYGGGGGSVSDQRNGGPSIYGGGGGGGVNISGQPSVYGGKGGDAGAAGDAPGGGGGANASNCDGGSGAAGRVIVTVW